MQINIGEYIRDEVLPDGITVKAAAALLGVGRPAFSNLLNGKASLSPAMAKKLENAFGASAKDLLQKQAESISTEIHDGAAASKVYVQPYLNLGGAHIQQWIESQSNSARSRLAVLIRYLVNSTVHSLTECDIPGNDHSQRHGWDGHVKASVGNPWVPTGVSGWEFGINKNVKQKADKDYAKSLNIPIFERKDTTFVFVTPRCWHAKNAWVKERKKEKNWKDVRAYDQSDLEQWLEQSIPGQAWLANELNLSSKGAYSLYARWEKWSADCDPPLINSLFTESLSEGVKTTIKNKLNSKEQIRIKADSVDEGLAFLFALFATDSAGSCQFQDRVVYFTEPGVMPVLLANNSSVVPVVATPDLEEELAPLKKHFASILIQPKNTSGVDADVHLDPLSAKAFDSALTEMGIADDDIQRLARESGRSLTVLRRRLSKTEAIRKPKWARNSDLANALIPIAFAGAWNSLADSDRRAVSDIAGDRVYEEVERDLLKLHVLEDPPVWMVDAYRGVVSKYDALFAIRDSITQDSISRFLAFAKDVLMEDDTSVDCPEGEPWLSMTEGKKREFSAMLRNSISETLVLLAVHEKSLFGDRLAINVESKISELIRNILSPMSTRLLQSQSSDLPMYSEAAPDEFLSVIEDDLSSLSPAVLDIINYKSPSMFSTPPYVGLLWALENIAWAPDRVHRCCMVLAELNERSKSENSSHSPANSLSSIFRSWFPQTNATLEQRQAVLKSLGQSHPGTAWSIYFNQIISDTSVTPNHRPMWRPDAHGAREGVSKKERRNFEIFALDQLLTKSSYTKNEVEDLIECLTKLKVRDQSRIWAILDDWRLSASETDKTEIREKIRATILTKSAYQRLEYEYSDKECNQILTRASTAFECLSPTNGVQRWKWLFENDYVDLPWNESIDDDDWDSRSQKVADLRKNALSEVMEQLGMGGILEIASIGSGAALVGWSTATFLECDNEIVEILLLALENKTSGSEIKSNNFVAGLLGGVNANSGLISLLDALNKSQSSEQFFKILSLSPFSAETWDFLDNLSSPLTDKYWKTVSVREFLNSDEIHRAFSALLKVERPLAALSVLDFSMSAVPLHDLYKALDKGISSKEHGHEHFFSRFDIEKALKLLGGSGDYSVSEMAILEYRFLPALDSLHPLIPNIEQVLNDSPEFFVQQVVYATVRDDENADPAEYELDENEKKMERARHSIILLGHLKRTPGRNKDGDVEASRLTTWIKSVQTSLSALARSEIGNYKIGQLLSNCGSDEDGCWPSQPVREAMEVTLTDKMARGFITGKFNSRGVHWKVEGGHQERKIAADFDSWAQRASLSHPRVAKILRDLRDGYLKDGEREDLDAEIGKRLR